MSFAGCFAMLVSLANAFGSATVDTRGARVVSYVPRGGSEVFAVFADGTGGLPVCAPYFAALGPEGAPRHGPARRQEFRVVRRWEGDEAGVELAVESDEATRRTYPYDYRITVVVRLAQSLAVEMKVTNAGTVPMAVTPAFHPYFRVGEATRCTVTGVAAEAYGVLSGPAHIFDLPAKHAAYRLTDPVLGRTFAFTSSGDRQVAVWTPGETPTAEQKAKIVSNFQPGETRRFVAVENGLLRRESAVRLAPGETFAITRTIRDATKEGR